jgi:ribonuclease HI
MSSMSYKKMKFRGKLVFIELDDSKEVILENGRANMKYQMDDDQIYNPNINNLSPLDGTENSITCPSPSKNSNSEKNVIAYTDGGCIGNPGPAGLGYVITFPDGRRIQKGEPLGDATNNIAELKAISRVLDLVNPSLPVVIHTDSEYSIGVLTRGWKAKANKELIGKIKKSLANFAQIEFIKVKGHAGIPENELVDDLARTSAETQTALERLD